MNKRILWVLLCSVLLVSCSKQTTLTENRILLGTVCRITVTDENAQTALENGFRAIVDVENAISRTKLESQISQINQQAGISPVSVTPEIFHLIKTSLYLAQISNGAFNPAIGPLVDLWGIGTEYARLPESEEIEEICKLCNWRDVELDEATYSVFLPKVGMALDLGGIGKGYAAEQVLESFPASHALINLGGDILVSGGKPNGSAWSLGLQDPFAAQGVHFMIIEGKDIAVVTSGPYERYFEQNGIRYHHILDTATGYPSETGISSVSIIARDPMLADALATAVYVMGKEQGMRLINELDGVEAVLVTQEGTVIVSAGFHTNNFFSWKMTASYPII